MKICPPVGAHRRAPFVNRRAPNDIVDFIDDRDRTFSLQPHPNAIALSSLNPTVLTMKQGKSDNNITDRLGLVLQWQHYLKVLSGKVPPEQNVGFIVAEESDRTQTKSMRSHFFPST
ncbi:hypothetical protein [Coleofasciculus sp. G2-EDA-02]|uniref:hypothetical protein n=1 Tax=Coleofasciculus sp. G2-EDA-02 TaxID=3069529 RepID=UPI0032F8D8F2